MSGGPGFWTRRRAAVAAEEEARARDEGHAEAAERAAALEEKSDEEILAELDLPDPDTLGAGDDFRAFMHRSVPLRLRRRALRQLWRSNPALACLDGLNDYDGDFTDAATNAPGLRTAYEVGRGLLRRAAEPETAEPAADVAGVPESPDDAEEPPQPLAAAAPEADPSEAAEYRTADAADAPQAPARPRRMTFRFQE